MSASARYHVRPHAPKLALKPTVFRPSATAPVVEYAPKALYVGTKVPPKVSQKAPISSSATMFADVASKRTEAGEYHARECVPNEPLETLSTDLLQKFLLSYLSNTSEDHEDTTEEEVSSCIRGSRAACSSPAHENAGQRGQTEEEASQSTIWISCRSELAGGRVLTLESDCRRSCGAHQRPCSVVKGKASRTAPVRWKRFLRYGFCSKHSLALYRHPCILLLRREHQ